MCKSGRKETFIDYRVIRKYFNFLEWKKKQPSVFLIFSPSKHVKQTDKLRTPLFRELIEDFIASH